MKDIRKLLLEEQEKQKQNKKIYGSSYKIRTITFQYEKMVV
ncbi:MAG: hypothetical protein ACLTEH_02765 [Clostridia bacterium]